MSWTSKRDGSYVNEMESLAILAELKARSRIARYFNTVYVHLVDSQLALGLFTKRRTSLNILQRVIRRASSLCLASNLMPVFLYVRSELNPADAPSRGRTRLQRDGEESGPIDRCAEEDIEGKDWHI